MSSAEPTLSPTPKSEPARFPSLASLRAAHTELLKRHREQGNEPAVLAEIEQLMWRGHATGAILDDEDDRWRDDDPNAAARGGGRRGETLVISPFDHFRVQHGPDRGRGGRI